MYNNNNNVYTHRGFIAQLVRLPTCVGYEASQQIPMKKILFFEEIMRTCIKIFTN